MYLLILTGVTARRTTNINLQEFFVAEANTKWYDVRGLGGRWAGSAKQRHL